MTDLVSLTTILGSLQENVGDADVAMGLLAEALGALNLPTREAYPAPEVMAIGTYLMGVSRKALTEVRGGMPDQTRPMAEKLDPMVNALRDQIAALVKESGGKA